MSRESVYARALTEPSPNAGLQFKKKMSRTYSYVTKTGKTKRKAKEHKTNKKQIKKQKQN